MKRFCRFSILSAAILSLLCIASSADVLRVVVNDTIHPITAEYIGRAIAQAEQNKSQAVLIELNTPGGLLDSTRDIIEKIEASHVPVIVYVFPSGSRAASAGFFILESADVAAMAPGTNTGAAHPVSAFGGKMDDTMKEKVENDSAAFMRSFVSQRGRNVQVAESAVRESKSFTNQEALKQNLIEYIASSEEDLFKQMDGKPLKRFDGQLVTLHLVGEPVRDFHMTLRQEILDFLMDPNMAFILLVVGALALYVEFNHPGAVLPGTGWRCLHSARSLRVQSPAYALRGVRPDSYFFYPVCAGGEVHHPRRAGDWGDRYAHVGRAAISGRTDPRDARTRSHRAGGEHSVWNYHGVFDEHRDEGAGQQSGDRNPGTDWRNRFGTNCVEPARKSFRSR